MIQFLFQTSLPKFEKKGVWQSSNVIMDIGSPQTIRVGHMFGFSKKSQILENQDFLGCREKEEH